MADNEYADAVARLRVCISCARDALQRSLDVLEADDMPAQWERYLSKQLGHADTQLQDAAFQLVNIARFNEMVRIVAAPGFIESFREVKL